MTSTLPLLYSFRRCPYAMRARLGILFADLQVELREIVLRDKPTAMLAISPKGTVPVLKIGPTVIDESLDILKWALEQSDPQGLLQTDLNTAYSLIERNDTEFKYWLDRYKYFSRHPEQTQLEYRLECESFLQVIEDLLTKNKYILGANISVADIAIMPFVRQFAHVDRDTFYGLNYPRLQQWLKEWLEHPLFLKAMHKYKVWQASDSTVLFPKESI